MGQPDGAGETDSSIAPYVAIVLGAKLLEDFGLVSRLARGHGIVSLLETLAEMRGGHSGSAEQADALSALYGEARTNHAFRAWLIVQGTEAYDRMTQRIWAKDVELLMGAANIVGGADAQHQYHTP